MNSKIVRFTFDLMKYNFSISRICTHWISMLGTTQAISIRKVGNFEIIKFIICHSRMNIFSYWDHFPLSLCAQCFLFRCCCCCCYLFILLMQECTNDFNEFRCHTNSQERYVSFSRSVRFGPLQRFLLFCFWCPFVFSTRRRRRIYMLPIDLLNHHII